jgi:DNA adenine methylase
VPPSSSVTQLTMWQMPSQPEVINVASVPQRSPFRYPGGKTWFVPRARSWLRSRPSKPRLLVEPFAGGATVGLTAAFESLAEHVLLVELDEQVAAVWEVLLGGEAPWLAERVLRFDLTPETAAEQLASSEGGLRELAFRTILRNRTFHGGILAPGATFVKHGEAGRGLRSRWYPETLARRMLAIHEVRSRLSFKRCDGLGVMSEFLHDSTVAFFVDPPYTAGGAGAKRAGSRLYRHHDIDHAGLFALAATAAGDVVMTYDDTAEVRALASTHGFEVANVAMKNTHHARMTELVIAKSVSWA